MKQSTNNQQIRKCVGLSFSFFSLSWLRLQSLLLALTNRLRRLVARVSMATTAILHVRITIPTGRKVLIGLLLMACGPLMKDFYRLLEWTIVPGAYQDPYYYFHAVRGDLATICYGTGFFLLVQERHLRFVALLVVPEALARVLYMATVTSNEEYHTFITISSVIQALSIGVTWLILFDYLMGRHCHRAWGAISRMDGMLKLEPKDIPNRDEKLANELETLKILLR